MKFTRASQAMSLYRTLCIRHAGPLHPNPELHVPMTCGNCGGPPTKMSRDGVPEPDPGIASHWKTVCAICHQPWMAMPPRARRGVRGTKRVRLRETKMAKPRPDSIDMKTTLDLCLDEFEKTNVWGYRLWAVLRCFHEIDHWEAIASAARSLWPAARGIPLSRWAIEKRCKDAERDFGTILQKRGMM